MEGSTGRTDPRLIYYQHPTPLPHIPHPHPIISKIHRRSDALVNLKLALAFSDRILYARAIALFQPIFEVFVCVCV